MEYNSNQSSATELASVTQRLLETLDARSRDIVSRRYGLISNSPETLESIGREYSITRERVRQIQFQAGKVLREQNELLNDVADMYRDIFVSNGGVLAETHVVSLVNQRMGRTYPNTISVFYLDILPSYEYKTSEGLFGPHWRDQQVVAEHTPLSVESAEEYLTQQAHPVAEDELLHMIEKTVEGRGFVSPIAHIKAQLIASKHIEQTPFGEWGLISWPETNPRGVGDKAYVVLRRSGKPQHFTRITELINEAGFDNKQANAQTVHNELIKDERFVLVGRGLYGLSEWGYISGTVADVIESLIAEAGRPLGRDELIAKVLEQRQVKKNTILLGLQNHDRFERTERDEYVLRRKES